MKHVTLLYPEGRSTLSTIACIIGTVEVFEKANHYWKQRGHRQPCQLVVAGTSTQEEYINGLVPKYFRSNRSVTASRHSAFLPAGNYMETAV